MLSRQIPARAATVLELFPADGKRFYYYPNTVSQVVVVPEEKLEDKAEKMMRDAAARATISTLTLKESLTGMPSSSVDVVVCIASFAKLADGKPRGGGGKGSGQQGVAVVGMGDEAVRAAAASCEDCRVAVSAPASAGRPKQQAYPSRPSPAAAPPPCRFSLLPRPPCGSGEARGLYPGPPPRAAAGGAPHLRGAPRRPAFARGCPL